MKINEELEEIEIDLEEEIEEEKPKLFKSKLKPVFIVKSGNKFISFKKYLSRNQQRQFKRIGSENIVFSEDMTTKAAKGKGLNDFLAVDFEKDEFLELNMYVDWNLTDKFKGSSEEKLKELLDEDVEYTALRALALKTIKKLNKIDEKEDKEEKKN